MTTPTAPRSETQEVIVESPATHNVLDVSFVTNLRGTTPNVEKATACKAANTAPVTVTNFLNGSEGNSISILGDGFTTIHSGGRIITNTGSDKLLLLNKVYRFTAYKLSNILTWIEDA